MSGQQLIYAVQGDTLPGFAFSLTQNGVPRDVTGCTFQLAFVAGSTTVTKAGSITDAPNGKVSFVWAPGDLSTAGNFALRFTIIDAQGGVQSFQHFLLVVQPRIGGP